MVGGCTRAAPQLSMIEISKRGQLGSISAKHGSDVARDPFEFSRNKTIPMSRFVAPTGMWEVTDGWWVHSWCTPAKF